MRVADVGWAAVYHESVALAVATRSPDRFDLAKRDRDVAAKLAKAKGIPLWPLPVAALSLALPNGTVWAGVIAGIWCLSVAVLLVRAQGVERELQLETNELVDRHQREAAELARVIEDADRGDEQALRYLLNRWSERCPKMLRGGRLDLRCDGEAWHLQGSGINRDAIPTKVPRQGARGRTVHDRRKAADVDEDAREVNAALVVSCLAAVFGGRTPRRVTAMITIAEPGAEVPAPWVVLDATIDGNSLQALVKRATRPADVILQLGGDVGSYRSQRMRPVECAAPPNEPTQISPANSPPEAPVRGKIAVSLNFAPVPLVQAPPIAPVAPAVMVPPPPDTPIREAAARAPTLGSVSGPFATVARKFADYSGADRAAFVPFQSYWPQYGAMSAGQLKYYFWWRNAVRQGTTPLVDLSYLFLHVYELLHVVGARDARDAGNQLERIWSAYRPQYPKLDNYLVTWTADLYATEVDAASARDFLLRASSAGAALDENERLVVTDSYWATADYAGMPRTALSLLAGDPRLGENKFYRECNAGGPGGGWVDQAYREAFRVCDSRFEAASSTSLRLAEVDRFGQFEIVREPFRSAVYDWKKKPARLGKVPRLTENGVAIPLYHNAVRYTENLLRKQRGFAGRLRGVVVDTAMAAALDAHFSVYARKTKPRVRVTIDLARAGELARESADVRARLLDGIDPEPATTDTAELEQHVSAGLLTDLQAVTAALEPLTPEAKSVLAALLEGGWEQPADSTMIRDAAGEALVGPLITKINAHALESIGQVLIVDEAGTLIVQEDYRDEVYWVLRGSLEGFGRERPSIVPGTTEPPSPVEPVAETEGFGPIELQALALVAGGRADELSGFAREHATTPLLLVDLINECGLASSHGDLIIDATTSLPAVLTDSTDFVTTLLNRVQRSASATSLEIDIPS